VARCELRVGPGGAVVDLDRCTTDLVVVATSKGQPGAQTRTTHLEITGLVGRERSDGYTDTLVQFGYRRSGPAMGLGLNALRQIGRRWWLGGFTAVVATPGWVVPIGVTPAELQAFQFDWTTLALGTLVRVMQPFAADGLLARCAAYAQAGAGLGVAFTRLTDPDARGSNERYFGWAMTGGGGVRLHTTTGIGISLGYQFDYAPLIDNLMGETHASGGHRLSVGLSYEY